MAKKRKLKKPLKKFIWSSLVCIFLVLCLYFFYQAFVSFQDERHTEDIILEIQEKIGEISFDNPTVDFDILKVQNEDTVGYIVVEGTPISYPVVQGEDNDYYLRRSFDQTYNRRGWIFMNADNHADMSDTNTVLFGHNTLDETMFGPLLDIYNGEYGNQIQITYYTPETKYVYQVYSIYLASPSDGTSIQKNVSSSFIEMSKIRSHISFEATSTSHQIITLSTCYYTNKDRIIMHGVLVESESES